MEIALTSVSPGVVDTTSLDQGFISAGPASGTGPTFSRVPGCDAEAAALGSDAATANPGATPPPERKSSVAWASVNYINSIIGAGIIGACRSGVGCARCGGEGALANARDRGPHRRGQTPAHPLACACVPWGALHSAQSVGDAVRRLVGGGARGSTCVPPTLA